MIIMAVKQMTNIQIISAPSFQWWVSWSSKGCSWESPMTMAKPLQNPNITGEGSRVMKRESLVTDTRTIKSPANMTWKFEKLFFFHLEKMKAKDIIPHLNVLICSSGKQNLPQLESSLFWLSSWCSTQNPLQNPSKATDGKSSSTPSPLLPVPAGGMKVPTMAAKAPVAPLTMPGRPPKALPEPIAKRLGGELKKNNLTGSSYMFEVLEHHHFYRKNEHYL